MKRYTFWYVVFGVLSLMLLVNGVTNAQTVNVTFQVKMNIQAIIKAFNPATDSVFIAGTVTTPTWGNGATGMVKHIADTTYTLTLAVPANASYEWKIIKGHTPSAMSWEGAANRPLVVTDRDTILDWVYYNNMATFIMVTYRTNMHVKIAKGAFDPLNDVVSVTGSMNGWPNGAYADTCRDLGSQIYGKAVPTPPSGETDYKYLAKIGGTDVWENTGPDNHGGNRYFYAGVNDTTLPWVWFDQDSLVSPPVNGTLQYGVDMSVAEQYGVFERPGQSGTHLDSVLLRGSADGWGDLPYSISRMQRVEGTEIYLSAFACAGFVGDKYDYKFYIKTDTSGGRYPLYHSGDPGDGNKDDDYNYEHPSKNGDGNHSHILILGDNLLPTVYYNDVHPAGFIPSGVNVSVTVQIDMRPALALADAFNPAGDTVFIYLKDTPDRWLHGFHGTEKSLQLTDPDGDLVYTGTFDWNGPAPYDMLYVYGFSHPLGAGAFQEGGGLGVDFKYRARFIRPPFVAGSVSYTFPIDKYHAVAPMPIETLPYDHLDGTPGAATLPATLTGANVVFHGKAYANALSGTMGFEYGPTTAYGTSVSAGALSDGAFSATAAAPAVGSYHYRAWVSDGVTTYHGLDQVYQVPNVRWNMVSAPYFANNNLKTAMYPTATTVAYAYDPASGYVPATTLKPGVGYWLKFNAGDLVSFAGGPADYLPIKVAKGWNLIGVVNSNILTSAVTASAGTSILTPFYAYTGAYVNVTTLTAGNAYWVKVSANGYLFLQGAGEYGGKEVASPLTKLNSVTITDAAGNHQTLYFGQNFADASKYEMPPVAPEGSFDARFSSGRMVESVDAGKTGTFPVTLTSAVYPVTVSWEMKDGATGAVVANGASTVMTKNGSVKITSGDIALKFDGNAKPVEFALQQNYPNPFNPTTEIKYSLPQDAQVKLSVYNVLGQEVLNLVNGMQEAGYHSVQFNASNFPSGVYFYRIEAGQFNALKKMMLVK